MTLTIDVKVTNDLPRSMALRVGRMERAVKTAVAGATAQVKTAWRADVASKLGRRLSGAVRAEVYPKGDSSLNAAGLVWTKAPKIIGAHERGALIRSENGFWLAIPLPAAGPRRVGSKAITPALWEQKNGRVLQFIYKNGRSAQLVDTGKKAAGNVMVRKRVRGGFELSEPRQFKKRYVPIFALVPQVKLPKRLNLKAEAMKAGQSLPGRVRTAIGVVI